MALGRRLFIGITVAVTVLVQTQLGYPVLASTRPPVAGATVRSDHVVITDLRDRRNGVIASARDGQIGHTVDGNLLTAHVRVTNTTKALVVTTVSLLDGILGPIASSPVTIAPNTTITVSLAVPTDGLAWDARGVPVDRRALSATLSDGVSSRPLEYRVLPRPVILVHGLNDVAASWNAWFRPPAGPGDGGGFLCRAGYPTNAPPPSPGLWPATGCGYPIDTINTKVAPTNTTTQNASILGQYIQQVQSAAGADRVDLVAHSMGGLISRYYISKFMPYGAVARLVMLGTPNMGSSAADISDIACILLDLCFTPQPATFENSPGFVQAVTNRAATRRQGVHFFAVAGNLTGECLSLDGYPSDLVVNAVSTLQVSVDATTYRGVSWLSPGEFTLMPVQHVQLGCAAAGFATEMGSQSVFDVAFRQMLTNAQLATPGQPPYVPHAPGVNAAPPVRSTQLHIIDARPVTLAPGGTTTIEVKIAMQSDLSASLLLPSAPAGSLPILTFTAPNGRRYTAAAPSGQGAVYADASRSAYLPSLAYSVHGPQNGIWSLTIMNRRNGMQGTLRAAAIITTTSTTGLALAGHAARAGSGQAVQVTAKLQYVDSTGKATVVPGGSGAHVTVQAQSMGEKAQNIAPLTLYDDGKHGDGAANDGVYGATITSPSRTGDTGLLITARSSLGQRMEVIPLVVSRAYPTNSPVGAS